MNVIYVLGTPGSGKTTAVVGALTRLYPDAGDIVSQPVPHVRYGTETWHLGKHRHPFGGTDTLSMSIQPKAVEWLHDLTQRGARPPAIMLAEGDRLANNSFFTAVRTCGHRLTLVHIDTPPAIAYDRMAARAIANGTDPQPIAWWKGRATKVNNLVSSRATITLDGTKPQPYLAEQLSHIITASRT